MANNSNGKTRIDCDTINTATNQLCVGQHQSSSSTTTMKSPNNAPYEEEDNECWDDAKEFNLDHLINSSKSSGEFGTNYGSGNNSNSLSLHEAVFRDDTEGIFRILDLASDSAKQIVNKKDKHGNTPLHLACILGRSKEVVDRLLQSGASIDTRNLQRWTPYHEATSYGNREIIKLMTKQLKDDVYDVLNRNKLSEKLARTKNYRLVLKWEFQSWVPFIARMLPNDVCVINKQGKFIRIDTKLLDLEKLWNRGDCCLIYSNKFEKKWIIMNNKLKKYQYFETQNLDTKDIETRVDEVMSIDIMDFELKSSDAQMTRSTSGWIWKADKIEKVGKYNSALYNFNNVFLVTRKRREHLTDDDVKRNKMAYKAAMHVLKFGKRPTAKDLNEGSYDDCNNDNNEDQNENWEDAEDPDHQHRESLSPPTTSQRVTWEQYITSKAGEYPNIGREHKCKLVKTAFKASLAMSDEFPLSKNEFLDLLSIVPLKHFKKLKEFIEMRLPDGFPIRVDIPVFPFLTARITFEDFTFLEDTVDESLFDIPSDYEEDPNLFPMLSGKFRR